MSDVDQNPGQTETPSISHDNTPLEHIIVENKEIGDCREWIYFEFAQGRDADSILAELLGNNWSTDDAEALVEQCRRATRHLRGAITRGEVARVAEKRYRKSFHIAFWFALGGLPLMCAHFLWSVVSNAKQNPWPDRVRSGRRAA